MRRLVVFALASLACLGSLACRTETQDPAAPLDAAAPPPGTDAASSPPGADLGTADLPGAAPDTRVPDDAATGDPSALLGAWQFLPGSNRMVTCPTLGYQADRLAMGRVTIERGTNALLLTLPDSTCPLKFELDAAGALARLQAGQACPPYAGKLGDGTPFTETDTFQTGNIAVSGGRATISLTGAAQIVVGTMTASCGFTLYGNLERATGNVTPPTDAGAPPPPDAGGTGPYRLTSGRYRATAITGVSDACELDPAGLVARMADLPVEIDAAGTIGIGIPRGTPPLPAFGRGTLDRTPGAKTRLVRQNQIMGEGGTSCAYGADVISLLTLDADDSFELSVVERQSNRRGCTVPPGIGPECNSFWSWRLTRVP